MRNHRGMNDSSNGTGPTGNVPPAGSSQPGGQYEWTPPTPNQGSPAGQKFFNSLRTSGFYRSEERWVGGVSGGLAQKYGVDPLLVRAAFVILSLLSGVGLIIYAAAWALLPEQRDGRIHAEGLMRGNFDGAHAGIIIALIIGFSRIDQIFWMSGWIATPFKVIFWLALTAAIIYAVYHFQEGKKNAGSTPFSPGPQTPSAGPTAPFFDAPTGTSSATTSSPQGFTRQSAGTPGLVIEQRGSMQPQNEFSETPWNGAGANPTMGTTSNVNAPPHVGSYQSNQPYTWTPPKPARAQVKSPGATQFAIVFGIFLLTTAVLLLLNNAGVITLNYNILPLLAGLAMSLGGLTVIVNGFRGHSAGSGGFFGILGLIAALGTSVLLGIGFTSHSNAQMFSDSDLTPKTVEEISGGYSFGAGEVNLDLTELDISDVPKTDLPIVIPISAGVGEVNIIIPTDLAVTADQTVGVGTAKASSGNTSTSIGGIGAVSNAHFANDQAVETDTADIFLDISLGLGEIKITEQDN